MNLKFAVNQLPVVVDPCLYCFPVSCFYLLFSLFVHVCILVILNKSGDVGIKGCVCMCVCVICPLEILSNVLAVISQGMLPVSSE